MSPYSELDAGHPRPLPQSLAARLGYEIGRLIDEGSVTLEARRIGQANVETLRRRADRYREAVAFLDRLGALDGRAPLFPTPRSIPGVERRSLRTLGLPPFESIRYASTPAAIFPTEMGTKARDPRGRNHLAYAYLWRHGDRGRTTIVCIHGYRGGLAALDGRAFGVDRLFSEGFDVALAILPYHGPRAPDGNSSGQPFLSDPRRTLEAVIQGILDLRILIAWLRETGAGRVGVAGFSLGGYMTAVLASVESGLDFAVPVIPVASFADILWERAGRRGEHALAASAGLSLELLRRLFAPHCPLELTPRVATDRCLVIAGEADRIAPPEHAEALAAHWNAPAHWFPGGHLAQFGRTAALARLRELAASPSPQPLQRVGAFAT